MGGLCSKGSPVDKSPSETTLDPNSLRDPDAITENSRVKTQNGLSSIQHYDEQQKDKQERTVVANGSPPLGSLEEQHAPRGFLQKSKSTKSKSTAKVSEMGLILGKAVDVLDTLGSSMTNLNLNSGFVNGINSKGNKISILAFEVANTIVKGANLMQSLSKENIAHLKMTILPSEGVQNLISRDFDELLRIAASDKREELKVFSKEVVRFGNQCKDPQWHNLNRYFEKLASELSPQKQLKEEAESIMEHLMTSVQFTAELYHELHALDRFDQDYRRKNQEDDNSITLNRADNLQILKQELRSQKKHVKGLKKKSLWSKNLEEVMEKLVDIVQLLHLEIHDAFGSADAGSYEISNTSGKTRLGPAGLALHYANIICQIDTLVSRSSSVPPNTRDSLYQGLPPGIKSALRSRLLTFQIKEEITITEIKSEMEKTLRWLVPIANNTTRAHHGFGWVGEWANTGSEFNRKAPGQTELTRIETLYHADQSKTESHILDLVLYLHHLISLSKPGGTRSPIKSPIRSPTQKGITIPTSTRNNNSALRSMLTKEDEEMLREVKYRKSIPGISKSQEFGIVRGSRLCRDDRLSKSNNHSPIRVFRREKEGNGNNRRGLGFMVPVINFELDKGKAMDLIDRVDNVRKF